MTRRLLLPLWLAAAAAAQIRVWPLPGKSPVVIFRLVFTAGSAFDPDDKPGVAYLTAMMLAEGGTKDLTYKQVLDALFPMAASVSAQVDKEMTTFSGATHVDNLEAYYKIFRAMLLEPGWREEDFRRVKDDAINFLRVSLRGANDEELGKEVLYNALYEGHPYGHHNAGTVSGLEKIALDDLKAFYRKHYARQALLMGIAGGYSPRFLANLKKDFRTLPAGSSFSLRLKPPARIERSRALIVEKDTRAVAYSLGYPIVVHRAHPDYPALLLAMTYFGQHRSSAGRLYQRMREARGLNYGDYSYLEYFPRGMFQFEPDPNLARRHQIFQIWIRPVEPANARFALRLALFELDKLVKEGLSQEDFERTREFLSKYLNLLMKTKRAQLGYALDSLYYGIPDYDEFLAAALPKLSRAWVNAAIRRHLRPDRLQIVAVANNAGELKQQLAAGAPSPITYNAPKPKEIVEEDKLVAAWNIGLRAEDITVIPVDKVFE